MQNRDLVSLSAMVVGTCILLGYALLNANYPKGVDTFLSYSYAREISEGSSVLNDAFFPNLTSNYAAGFHVFLALLHTVTGLDLNTLLIIAPLILNSLIILPFYVLAVFLTKSRGVGITSSTLFAFSQGYSDLFKGFQGTGILSNAFAPVSMIWTSWYPNPQPLAFILMLSCLSMFMRSRAMDRSLILSALFLGALVLTHPFTTFITVQILLVYTALLILLQKRRRLLPAWRTLSLLVIGFAVAAPVTLSVYAPYLTGQSQQIPSIIDFWRENPYPPYEYPISIGPVFLLAIPAFLLLKRSHAGIFLLSWSLITILGANLVSMGIMVMEPIRALNLFQVAVCILAGIFVVDVVKAANRKNSRSKTLAVLLFAVLLAVSIYPTTVKVSAVHGEQSWMDDTKYDAYKWVAGKLQSETIFSEPFYSTMLAAYTGVEISSVDVRLANTFYTEEMQARYNDAKEAFTTSSPETARRILEDYGAKYILTARGPGSNEEVFREISDSIVFCNNAHNIFVTETDKPWVAATESLEPHSTSVDWHVPPTPHANLYFDQFPSTVGTWEPFNFTYTIQNRYGVRSHFTLEILVNGEVLERRPLLLDEGEDFSFTETLAIGRPVEVGVRLLKTGYISLEIYFKPRVSDQGGEDITVIADDAQSGYWKTEGGVSIGDDPYERQRGVDSLDISPTTPSFIYHSYNTSQDWSTYQTLSFWWRGSASNKTVEVNMDAPNPENKFQATFMDTYEGWHEYRFKLKEFTKTGDGDWSDVKLISIGGNWSNGTYRLDHLTLERDYLFLSPQL